jgi:hypothetical protein
MVSGNSPTLLRAREICEVLIPPGLSYAKQPSKGPANFLAVPVVGSKDRNQEPELAGVGRLQLGPPARPR